MAEEKTENKEVAASPPAGGGSKLGLIISVLNLVLILGIGAVVFIQFQRDKHRESVSDINSTEEPAGEAGKAGEHGGGEKKAEGEHGGTSAKTGAQVITLEQFTVNLSTSPGTPPRFARVVIAVEVASGETATELNTKTPQVRNAILDLFNSKRPSDLQTGEGRNFLKEEIRNALNSFLVTGKVKGVFFSNFVVGN
ncbi:MAG: flagellar basal body-associated FliL family protein [Bdellovibrionales bacterium]|nr:flagellar basal body-associated FliL family protein [Bdellovibrionales bacterium]